MFINNKNFNQNKSNICPNIFNRIRLLAPEIEYEGVIIYESPHRARIAISWEMILVILNSPITFWNNQHQMANLFSLYIYNWNNNSNIRNVQISAANDILRDVNWWVWSSITTTISTNRFHSLFQENSATGGVYVYIQLDEFTHMRDGVILWEIWNNQFNLDNC